MESILCKHAIQKFLKIQWGWVCTPLWVRQWWLYFLPLLSYPRSGLPGLLFFASLLSRLPLSLPSCPSVQYILCPFVPSPLILGSPSFPSIQLRNLEDRYARLCHTLFELLHQVNCESPLDIFTLHPPHRDNRN